MKGSFDVTSMSAKGLEFFFATCSACLLHAHARTGDSAAISGYLGGGEAFDQAISKFAVTYADQTRLDFQALVDAVNKGQIVAELGV